MNMRLKLVIINSLQMLILEIYQIAARMCIFHSNLLPNLSLSELKKDRTQLHHKSDIYI